MSRDLGQDVPDLQKPYARNLWADFSFPILFGVEMSSWYRLVFRDLLLVSTCFRASRICILVFGIDFVLFSLELSLLGRDIGFGGLPQQNAESRYQRKDLDGKEETLATLTPQIKTSRYQRKMHPF